MKKSRKIAYLCHIDWNWIKQRPQFIAEGLAEQDSVDFYCYPPRIYQKISGKFPIYNSKLRLYTLLRLPFSGRSKIIKRIQTFFNTFVVRFRNYDMVWVCSPEVLAGVDINRISAPIIYDCMDDMIENHSMPKYKAMLFDYEQTLIEKASCVFVSSINLQRKMITRGCSEDKIVTIYNATNPLSLLNGKQNQTIVKDKGKFTLTYFGTISRWIDMGLLYRILDDPDLSDVHIRLIGPAEIELLKHPRLEHIPPVPHNMLSSWTTDTDLFILPFILNDITLSVDPVKLYEYIALRRNIVAIYYPELERYSEYVNFYNNYDELKTIVVNLRENNTLTYDRNRVDVFVSENTWSRRIETITAKLNSISVAR